MARITLSFDEAALESVLAEIAQAPLEVRDRALCLFEASEELVSLKVDDHATLAGELVVRAYPSDALARLVPALWAGN